MAETITARINQSKKLPSYHGTAGKKNKFVSKHLSPWHLFFLIFHSSIEDISTVMSIFREKACFSDLLLNWKCRSICPRGFRFMRPELETGTYCLAARHSRKLYAKTGQDRYHQPSSASPIGSDGSIPRMNTLPRSGCAT